MGSYHASEEELRPRHVMHDEVLLRPVCRRSAPATAAMGKEMTPCAVGELGCWGLHDPVPGLGGAGPTCGTRRVPSETLRHLPTASSSWPFLVVLVAAHPATPGVCPGHPVSGPRGFRAVFRGVLGP